jgi:hypothetical protein
MKTSEELLHDVVKDYGHFLLGIGVKGKNVAAAQGYMKARIGRVIKRALDEAQASEFSRTMGPTVEQPCTHPNYLDGMLSCPDEPPVSEVNERMVSL